MLKNKNRPYGTLTGSDAAAWVLRVSFRSSRVTRRSTVGGLRVFVHPYQDKMKWFFLKEI